MDSILLVLTTAAFLLHGSEGYSSGAPAFVCGDLTPSHSPYDPQLSLPPYNLTASSNTYQPGETITVILQSMNNNTFKGYLIIAKDTQTATIHGTFSNATNGQEFQCGSSGTDAVTHTSSEAKSLIEVQWQPTASTRGSIIFLATVVESYEVFWTKIESVPISSAMSSLQPPVVTTTKPPLAPSGSLEYDEECGVTKGCFVDCSGTTCNYVLTWRDNGNVVDFELATNMADANNKYIAIGFSTDVKMGGDEVVTCLNVGGNTHIERSVNNGYSNAPVANKTAGISNEVVTIQNGVFRCSFTKSKQLTRRNGPTSRSLYVNLDEDYHVMFATGSAVLAGGTNYLSKHITLPPVTASKVDFQSFEVIGDTAKYPLVKVHACLMIIAWIFCTCVAIIAARHYKPVWSKSSLFSQKIWFQIHRTLMVTATTLTIIAFIIIFVEVGGYSKVTSSPGKEYLPYHPILGIIVTILCILNPIMSLFRPAPTSKNRPVFNWAHWSVGMVAQILAILTIVFGVEMQKSSAPVYTIWVVVGFVIYYVLMEITQKVIDKLAERSKGEVHVVGSIPNGGHSGSSYNLSQSTNNSDSDKNTKDTLLKKSLLALHVICTLAFTLTLVLLVSMD